MSFLTIHGKSNFPGLSVWTREGKKIGVTVPDGCLLVQAGQQLEYLTGGHVKAGYHEVVLSDAARESAARAGQAGESQWRISSTVSSSRFREKSAALKRASDGATPR